jgi:drug/metabolite transporter (DMT)-like permease
MILSNPRLFISISFLLKSLGDALAKYIREQGMSASELTFFRFLFGLAFVLLSIKFTNKESSVKILNVASSTIKIDYVKLIWRGILGLISVWTGLWAAPYLTLGDARAISYINPLFFAVFGFFVFHEKIVVLRWIALGCGFLGVVIVTNPSAGTLSTAAWVLLFGGIAAAWSDIQVKKLQLSNHSTMLILCVFFAVSMLGILPFYSVDSWYIPSLSILLLTVVFALINFLFQFLYTECLKVLGASEAAPYQYTTHIWVLLIDRFVWFLPLSARSIFGTAFIFLDGVICYLLFRKKKNVYKVS